MLSWVTVCSGAEAAVVRGWHQLLVVDCLLESRGWQLFVGTPTISFGTSFSDDCLFGCCLSCCVTPRFSSATFVDPVATGTDVSGRFYSSAPMVCQFESSSCATMDSSGNLLPKQWILAHLPTS